MPVHVSIWGQARGRCRAGRASRAPSSSKLEPWVERGTFLVSHQGVEPGHGVAFEEGSIEAGGC